MGRVDTILPTFVAAVTFPAAMEGIDPVAALIPPACCLKNLAPSRISARTGGIVAAVIACCIASFRVAKNSAIEIVGFGDTPGAVLTLRHGSLVADDCLLRKRVLVPPDLFDPRRIRRLSSRSRPQPQGADRLQHRGLVWAGTVWVPGPMDLSGPAWLIDAATGGALHLSLMRKDHAFSDEASGVSAGERPRRAPVRPDMPRCLLDKPAGCAKVEGMMPIDS